MNRKYTLIAALSAALLIFHLSLRAQSIQQKFSFGIRGGPNLWVNDMNDRRIGFGVEGLGRWGVASNAAIGAVLGFEALKSGQVPTTTAIPFGYLKLSAFHGSVCGWVYLSSGQKFVPYLYGGIGGMSFTRGLGNGVPHPSGDKSEFSIYVPVGMGFEVSTGKSVAFMIDFGYRILNKETDAFPNGADSYPTVKLGLTYSYGSNDYDDEDGDGLSNGREKELGTDPKELDTDKDELRDGEEIRLTKTDPTKADTDADGIRDGDEYWKFRTNPLKDDTDADGLIDGEELYKYNTDPLKADTDSDGLSDGEEVLGYKTNPLKADSDGDTVSDQSEIFAYKTDPLKADTDGGGVDDGVEVRRGTNLLNPADDFPEKKTAAPKETAGESQPKPSANPEKPKTTKDSVGTDSEIGIETDKPFIVEGLTFTPWKTDITSETEVYLEPLLQMLSLHADVAIEIHGYTDSGGNRTQNVTLSRNRARAVRKWLMDRGIDGKRMSAKGHGPDNPVAPNDTDENKAKNRRIEIVRVK